ncbi:MAG TPA: hypothetical protein VK395_28810 [Gemmataceae bacterium]|nr:hypothetical protein [Gemmataceae bacterium]
MIRIGTERGERFGGVVQVHHTGPGVSAGQFQGRMPHEFLDHPGRHSGGIGQSCHLATQGVEVEHQSASIDVGDSRPFQVGAKHLRSTVRCKREDRPSMGQAGDVSVQVKSQVGGKGQGRRLAVLRVASGNGHGRGVPLPVE